jgi:8-oxo-dGTP diphosphatase
MRHIPASSRFTAVVAVHLFLIRDDEILLLRRCNTGYADGQYSVIAGHLDGGEELTTAMIREAREEAGIQIGPADLQPAGVMHRLEGDERIDFFFTCSAWSGDVQNLEPEKCDDLRWVRFDDLPDNVVPYVRRAIDNYLAGRWFDSFGWD